jgi:CheY-like chemotaxis protein
MSFAESLAQPIRILHVDDQSDFTELTATYLKRNDDSFSIVTATSANEGLELLEQMDFDCIISDYDMPRKTGIEFLRAVRDVYRNLPFICCAA